jgi:PAS domain S-box-containing protein
LTLPQPFVWMLCLVVLGLVVNYLRKSAATPKQPQSRFVEETAEAGLADLFDTAPIGYLEIDRKGVIQRINRQHCAVLDAEAAQFVGRPCSDLVPEAERARYRGQLGERMSGELALSPYERDYLKPDGSTVAVEVHEQWLYDRSGRIAGMRMAAIDVSPRKKSEQESYQIAAELRALFQAFPDFFLHLDRDGKVLDSKGGQRSDPFLAPEAFSGKNIEDVLPAVAMAQIREAQGRVRKTHAMEITEFTVDGRFGEQCYEARLLPLDWEQWIAILRNITDRKTDERTLKQYAEQLEQKNLELESALVTAREATQMKSRFLANMSHEIRTPMNGVLGMTDFLLGTSLNEEQLEFAHSIQRSARSLLTLINDILDLSRIEAGKLRLEPVAFSLRTLLEETTSLFALQARAKDLEFVCDFAPGLAVTAVGDPDRLRQVLINLLGNAIKFTEAGRVGLTAEFLNETETGFQARFTVFDTGIGIPRDQHGRVFESFTQGDTSSTRKYGGTGLGLAISKQLVDLLGGEIGLESEPGRGSRFWFKVPLAKPAAAEEVSRPAPAAAAGQEIRAASTPETPRQIVSAVPHAAQPQAAQPQAAQPQAARPPETPVNPGREGILVLLAEDNEINQRITLRLLQKLGLTADVAVNGREAVEAFARKSYDLVLMDCQMPIMDGFEATAIIRSRESSERRTPICALTANAMAGDRERCLASGMDDYISKPVSIDKLQAAVERWLPSVVSASAGPASDRQA